MNKELIVIAGPTGIGKTRLAVELASSLQTEIISADSRQIYREMNIGTAVPSDEDLNRIRHHFIRTVSINEHFNAGMYETAAVKLIDRLFEQYDRLIMAGGSGLYIDAVRKGIDDFPETDFSLRRNLIHRFENEGLDSLVSELSQVDPESYRKIDLKNHKRVLKALEISLATGKPYSAFLNSPFKKRNFTTRLIALDMNRDELYERINLRVLKMLDAGLVDEVRQLVEFRKNNALNTVGYKEIFTYFDGTISLDEAISRIQANSRKYARKQLTWFRKGDIYEWFHPDDLTGILKYLSHGTADHTV